MFLKLQVIILLVSFSLGVLKGSEPGGISKLDFLLSHVFEPYQHAINNFEESLNAAICDPFQSIFGDSLQVSCSYPTSIKPSQFIKQKGPTSLKQQDSTIKIDKEQNRMLQGFSPECMNGGFFRDFNLTTYICNGRKVTKSYYESNQNNNCTTARFSKKLCYCPFDYYGEFCEYFNSPVCKIETISHPQGHCIEKDSRAYVYSYGQNDTPCYFVKRNSELKLIFKATCEHKNPRWNYEGVKIEDEEPITELQVTKFNYKVDTPNLKLSQYLTIPLELRFANWKKLFKPLVIEEKLTQDQMTGTKDISFALNLDSKFQDYRFGGRYHYEVSVGEPFKVQNKVTGVLEDADYKEPKTTNTNQNSWQAFSFLLAIVLVVITLVFLKYKKLIFTGKTKKKEEYIQLVEMNEFDHSDHSTS